MEVDNVKNNTIFIFIPLGTHRLRMRVFLDDTDIYMSGLSGEWYNNLLIFLYVKRILFYEIDN